MRPSRCEFGLTHAQWSAVKAEVRTAILEAAYDRRMTSYDEIAGKVSSVEIQPHSRLMMQLLGELFVEECRAGRPALPAIVRQQPGDDRPGRDFYRMAQALGYQVGGPYKYWAGQVKEVFERYGKAAPAPAEGVDQQLPVAAEATAKHSSAAQHVDDQPADDQPVTNITGSTAAEGDDES